MTITIDFFQIFDIARWVFIVIDALLFAGLLYVTKQNWGFRPKYILESKKDAKAGYTLRKALFEERWEKINEKVEAANSY